MTEVTANTIERCPECSAPMVEGMTCWEQLGLLLAWEHNDPELRAEHFLTVAAYNLQHPAQFSDEALVGLRTVFIDYLDHGLTIAEIRHRVGQMAAGNKRVLKDETERKPVQRPWPMTIADVCLPHRPEGAATRVRAWAASIRQQL